MSLSSPVFVRSLQCALALLVLALVVACLYACTTAPSADDPFTLNTGAAHDPLLVRVYWTGGFDSTFRVLQATLDEGRTVVPYYLAGDIDNTARGKTRRRNRVMELRAMERVRTALQRDFPLAAARLQPLVVVEDVPLSDETHSRMRALHRRKVVRRPTCQYGSLGQYALRQGQPIEIGIVRDGHSNAGIYAGIHDKVAGVGASCRLTDSALRAHPEYTLFKNCVFPLLHLQKPDMLRIAKTGGYDHLLRETWSCWYPTANDQPCNKCLMCRERVLRDQGGHRQALHDASHHPSDHPAMHSSHHLALAPPEYAPGPVSPFNSASPTDNYGSEVVLGRPGGGGAGGGVYAGGGFGPASHVALGL